MALFTWPPISVSSSSPSTGSNGSTAPVQSTEVGFVDGSGNLRPLSGASASSGPNVAVSSSALPAGASTSALQAALNALFPATIGQKTMAGSLGVAIASDQGALPVSGTFWQTTQPVSGTFYQATQPVSAAALPLPSGAATSALQTTISGQLPAALGAKTTAASMSVNIASDQVLNTTDASNGSVTGGAAGTKSALVGALYNSTLPTLTNGQQVGVQVDVNGRQILGTSAAVIGAVTQSGTWNAGLSAGTNGIGSVGKVGSTGVSNAPVNNQYGTTNILTSAYTQLIASTTAATNFVDIFDSSGQAMILATGGAGSEVVLAYVPPGGDQIQVAIPAGTRVAYKALTANATSGFLLMNLWK